jgi:hypothetical protein
MISRIKIFRTIRFARAAFGGGLFSYSRAAFATRRQNTESQLV